jgi:Flp pilus assembly protein TadD
MAWLVFCGAGFAESSCVSPESMAAKLTGKPDASALNDLGVWFGEQQKYDCAARAFASSLQMDPHQKDFAHVAFEFGASLYLSGDTSEAIAALQEAEKFGYNDIKLHLLLAQALESTHATHDAEVEWRAALGIDPEYTDALDSLSNDLMADGNYKAVVELLDTPRVAPQRTVQQAMNLAEAYVRLDGLKDAELVLQDAVNTYPDSMPLAQQLAHILTQSGNKDEAEAVLAVARDRQSSRTEGRH